MSWLERLDRRLAIAMGFQGNSTPATRAYLAGMLLGIAMFGSSVIALLGSL